MGGVEKAGIAQGVTQPDLIIGCLPCVEQIPVAADSYDAETRLRELIGADISVRDPSVSSRCEPATCGLRAMNGDCPNIDDLDVLRELINSGEIPGVQVL